jgi:hypothetical protein
MIKIVFDMLIFSGKIHMRCNKLWGCNKRERNQEEKAAASGPFAIRD